MALRLLAGRPAHERAVARALAFLETDENADGSWGSPGSPCETALALSSLARGGRAGP